jgi:hypothetical protein
VEPRLDPQWRDEPAFSQQAGTAAVWQRPIPGSRVAPYLSEAGEFVEHSMTLDDVVVLLQIDRATVYRMARRGDLRSFKVSSSWHVLKSRLQRSMENRDGQTRCADPGRPA